MAASQNNAVLSIIPLCLNTILVLLSFIWLISLKNLLKRTIFLQRSLIMFLGLNSLSRLVMAVSTQACSQNKFEQFSMYVICDILVGRAYMLIDLFATVLNFSVYFTLAAYWIEQYVSLKVLASRKKKLKKSTETMQKMRQVIHILFWVILFVISAAVFTAWFILVLGYQLSSGTLEYILAKLFIRISLSISIILLLMFCMLLICITVNGRYFLNFHVLKIGLVTVVCIICFSLLTFYNFFKTTIDIAFMLFANGGQPWYFTLFLQILSVIASTIEFLANLVLLLSITPKIFFELCLFPFRQLDNIINALSPDAAKAKAKKEYLKAIDSGEKRANLGVEGGLSIDAGRGRKNKNKKKQNGAFFFGLDEDFDDDNGIIDSGELVIDSEQVLEYFHSTGAAAVENDEDDLLNDSVERESVDAQYDVTSMLEQSGASAGRYFEMDDVN